MVVVSGADVVHGTNRQEPQRPAVVELRPRGPWELSEEIMKKLIAACLLALVSSFAFAHGGGLDSDGCHIDHKTGFKHCH